MQTAMTDEPAESKQPTAEEQTQWRALQKFQRAMVLITAPIMIVVMEILIYQYMVLHKKPAHPVGRFELIVIPAFLAAWIAQLCILRKQNKIAVEQHKMSKWRLPNIGRATDLKLIRRALLVECIMIALFSSWAIHISGLDTTISRITGWNLDYVFNALFSWMISNTAWVGLTRLLARYVGSAVHRG